MRKTDKMCICHIIYFLSLTHQNPLYLSVFLNQERNLKYMYSFCTKISQ